MSMRGLAWLITILFGVAFWICMWLIWQPVLKKEHLGPGEAIQGLYSHRSCDTQPGTAPWFNHVNHHTFFMGCR
jgi:hypothetical protein